eukprot:s226_g36.t1
MQRLDATSDEQAMWIGALSDAIMLKFALETQLLEDQKDQQQEEQLKVYAGGSDSTQVRTALKTAAMKDWSVMGTDVRTAFLNAKRRDESKLVAMSIPSIFKRLGLAGDDEVWLVEMALYGLTTSPRDWSLHRDDVLKKLTWKRLLENGATATGRFERCDDDNLWRLVETDPHGNRWCGLLCVYVDDLLFCGEQEVLCHALKAVESQWSCAEAEWATTTKPLKFCGIEILINKEGNGLHLSQKGYEREMLDRWQVQHGVAVPHFKLSESDFDAVDAIDPKTLKEAQALAGALLWLATKTRPDLAFGVSAMSRLMARNPLKALEVGQVLLSYVKADPGDLHYAKTFPNDGWGERRQLKHQRDGFSIEVFSDIAYAAGVNHRSIQGIAAFFAGSPVAWQSSQQPFVTHSTAEAELVSYCESLLIGRATEALLCAMWGEPLTNQNKFSRTIYGDNMAAIGLASGTTCSSSRTRHLRIRASILKEAIDEEGCTPGGVWRLLHLKGTELVADGLTKQLLGQAFDRFVSDLGMKCQHQQNPEPCEGDEPQSGASSSAAIAALMTGSMMLSGMDAVDENDGEAAAIWACGAALMVFGAIHVAQLTAKTMRCCLRRLQRLSTEDVAADLVRKERRRSSDDEMVVVSEEESDHSDGGAMLRKPTTCSATKTRSGFSRRKIATTSQSSSSQSGCHETQMDVLLERPLQQSESGAGAPISTTVRTPSGSSNAAGSISMSMPKPSGSDVSSSTTPLSLKTRLGTSSKTGASSQGMSRPSGLASMSAAGSGEISGVSESAPSGQSKPLVGSNPWNIFQHEHRNQGLTSTMLSKMYIQTTRHFLSEC